MKDPRLNKLAHLLLEHSVSLKDEEIVLIKGDYKSKPLLKELVKVAYELNANPIVQVTHMELNREVLLNQKEKAMNVALDWGMNRLKDIDAIVSVYAEENDSEYSDVPAEVFIKNGEIMKPYRDAFGKKKWVLLNYPTPGLAQKAGMSLEKFSDYLIDVCTVDYKEMYENMRPLVELMEATNKVRIISPGTDLTFSIKDIPVVPCAGEYNIPDGEVFTAPVKDSVNGVITYNTPSPYRGKVFNDVQLTFKDGKIVEATCSNSNEELNKIFDTDEGSRFVGEFALGVNPLITEPMGDILFDEKIMGSFHFTPGAAYEDDADNGNRSAVHWDLVQIQTDAYGGGEIYFDGVLIRKDGMFVIPELEKLNP